MRVATLIPILSLFSITFAAPAPSTDATDAKREYYLKTKVVNGGSSEYNGLYVEAYHTGAGFNDAVLVNSTATAAKGFLNETYQQFDLGTDFPWGFAMISASNYAVWEPVEINAGYGDAGFYFNNTDGSGVTGEKWVPGYPYFTAANASTNEFGGWLACYWYHQLPQLFWRVQYPYPATFTYPCNCAEIELVREFI